MTTKPASDVWNEISILFGTLSKSFSTLSSSSRLGIVPFTTPRTTNGDGGGTPTFDASSPSSLPSLAETLPPEQQLLFSPTSPSTTSMVVLPKKEIDPETQGVVDLLKAILTEYYQTNGPDDRGLHAGELGCKTQWGDVYRPKFGQLKKFIANFPEIFKVVTIQTTTFISLIEPPNVNKPQKEDPSAVLYFPPPKKISYVFPFPEFFENEQDCETVEQKISVVKYLTFNNFQPVFSSPTTTNTTTTTTPEDSHLNCTFKTSSYDFQTFIDVFPENIKSQLLKVDNVQDNIVELILDLGKVPQVRLAHSTIQLGEEKVTRNDLQLVVSSDVKCKVTEFASDNRAGIDSTLHRISRIVNRNGALIGLTCRFGRAISGIVDATMQDIVCPSNLNSTLILGSPGTGKTTLLRDIIRVLADVHKLRVVVVDTSNELGGDGDIAHPGIGSARRLQVPDRTLQHQLMVEAVSNHTPEVIVVDEITNVAEAGAAQTIAQRGIRIVATAHGSFLGLTKNPILCGLLGGIQPVTMSDQRAKQQQGGKKSLLERIGEPTFGTCLELVSKDTLAVYRDTALAVDSILSHDPFVVQIRKREADGRVSVRHKISKSKI